MPITHGHSHHSNYMIKCLLLAFWFHIDNIKPISHLSQPAEIQRISATRLGPVLFIFHRGGCGRYPKHAPKSGFSAIRKECLGENGGNFTVVRVHVVRGCAPICRKFYLGFFARGGLDHLPGAARRAAAWLHVLCLRCVIGNRKSGL